MMPKRCLFILLLVAGVLLSVRPAPCASIKNWMCFYGAEAAPADSGRFDLIVLDGAKPPALMRTSPGKPLLLGSISVGESDSVPPSGESAHDQAYLAGQGGNATAPILDLRSARWQTRLLETLIPKVLEQGFDGILLDTIDSALARTQGQDAAQHAELRASVIAFLGELRQRFPGIPIAMNRGLELMPEAAPHLNFLLVEDLSFEYDFGSRESRAVKPLVRQVLMAAVRKAQAANPGLTVLTLDYARPDQTEQIREAIRYSRSKGFVPYIGAPALDQLFLQTLPR